MRSSNGTKLTNSLLMLLAGAWLLVIATPAFAVFTQCPPVGLNTGCAILITITDTGTTIVGDPNPPNNGPYDGVEDTLVGVQNSSSSPVSKIHLSSPGISIFGFDGDGPCTATPAGTGCSPPPNDYGGPGVTFSGINGTLDAGDVNFSPPIPPGGSAWFGLEEALTAQQLGGGPPPPPPPPAIVPTLSEWGLMILIGLMLVAGFMRFRSRRR